MISRWPVRTSVLLDEDILYVGAGVFPNEGIYILALRAKDGELLWSNNAMGDQSHALDFGGFSPQGYLLASTTSLFVPSGRAMPVLFDKRNGAFKTWLSSGGKVGGAWTLLADQGLIAGIDRSGTPAKVLFDAETGSRKGDAYAWFPGLELAVTPSVAFAVTLDGVFAIDRELYPRISAQLDSIVKEREQLHAEIVKLRNILRTAHGEEARSIERRLSDIASKISETKEEEARLKNTTCRWVYPQRDLHTLIVCGSSVLVGGDGCVFALSRSDGHLLWESKVDGQALGLALGNDSLIVSTDIGSIHCLGSKRVLRRTPHMVRQDRTRTFPTKSLGTSTMAQIARSILKETKIRRGYCLCLGAGDGRIVWELCRHTNLKFLILESDQGKRENITAIFQSMGLYGNRVVLADWSLVDLPDYFADLIISPDLIVNGKLDVAASQIQRLLKPCGGTLALGIPRGRVSGTLSVELEEVKAWLESADMKPIFREDRIASWMIFTRGKLPGAGEWTHQYANTRNTACSDDELVRSPLQVLWFGEPGSLDMVDRHARSAAPLSMDGRLIIQGGEVLMAYDAYNGTALWRRDIPGAVRVRVDVDGSNMALTREGLFVACYDRCLHVDPATGKDLNVFRLPPRKKGPSARWAYVAIQNGLLIGSRSDALVADYADLWKVLSKTGEWMAPEDMPAEYRSIYRSRLASFVEEFPGPSDAARSHMHRAGTLWRNMAIWPGWGREDTPAGTMASRTFVSEALFAFDLNKKDLLWVREDLNVHHPSICISEDIIYFLDIVRDKAQQEEAKEERRALIETGIYEFDEQIGDSADLSDVRRLVALHARSGDMLWERVVDLAGCGGSKVGVAMQDGVLLFFAHYSNHDRSAFEEGKLRWRRILAMDADSQKILWSRPLNYLRRPLVVQDKIIIEPRACSLKTGHILSRIHPITGLETPFEFLRPGHSCGITSASLHTLFYRSYCTAIYDLETDEGLTLFGGIRPGCWVNLIPANGLLLFPEASSGCTCSFPLRCSVAMKPTRDPSSKPWNVFIGDGPQAPVRHLAVNLGSPGDTRDDSGTLWFAYPRPKCWYGIKLDLEEEFDSGCGFFQGDLRLLESASMDRPWLYASGGLGLNRISLPLNNQPGREEIDMFYTIRMGFKSMDGDVIGQRRFDVFLNGEKVFENVDIKRDGDSCGILVKEIPSVLARGNVRLQFFPKNPSTGKEHVPILHWIEAIREERLPRSAAALPRQRRF